MPRVFAILDSGPVLAVAGPSAPPAKKVLDDVRVLIAAHATGAKARR